jgi:hypothetical protein
VLHTAILLSLEKKGKITPSPFHAVKAHQSRIDSEIRSQFVYSICECNQINVYLFHSIYC